MLSGLSENLSFLISLVPQARGRIHSEDEDRKKEMHVRFVHFELLSKKSMLTHYLCCFSLLAEAGLCAIKETGRCNHAQYKTYCLWYEEAEDGPGDTLQIPACAAVTPPDRCSVLERKSGGGILRCP